MNVKKALVHFLDKSGLAWLLRPLRAGRGVIVGLHRVTTPDQPSLMPGNDISAQLLTDMLAFFRESRYDIIPIEEVSERLRSRSGRSFAVFTFDDGFLDNLTVALPIFRKFEAPFTVFPVTGIADGQVIPWWVLAEYLILNSDSLSLVRKDSPLHLPATTFREKIDAFAELTRWGFRDAPGLVEALVAALQTRGINVETVVNESMLSWARMREMRDDPLVSFGVHTVSHAGLTRLSDEQVVQEVSCAQARLQQELGSPARHIAYPFGWYGNREMQIVKELKFETGVTVERGTLHSKHSNHLLALPRIMPSAASHANNMAFVRTSVYGLWNDVVNLVLEPRR